MGRKKIPIDWNMVDVWLEQQHTTTEIAKMLGVDTDTVYFRFQKEFGESFSVYAKQKREQGKSKYINQLLTRAKQSDAMAIFIAKSVFGLSEKKLENDISTKYIEMIRQALMGKEIEE